MNNDPCIKEHPTCELDWSCRLNNLEPALRRIFKPTLIIFQISGPYDAAQANLQRPSNSATGYNVSRQRWKERTGSDSVGPSRRTRFLRHRAESHGFIPHQLRQGG